MMSMTTYRVDADLVVDDAVDIAQELLFGGGPVAELDHVLVLVPRSHPQRVLFLG
jgi:hypothetical protein